MLKKQFKTCLFALLTLACLYTTNSLEANHIIGGEITYECVDDLLHQYKINLTVYRDCWGEGAPFDDPAYLFIYEGTDIDPLNYDGEPDKENAPIKNTVSINPPSSICIETLPDVCVEKATYTDYVFLSPLFEGYTIMYQRYSRNELIKNIVEPTKTGSTFMTTIPGTELIGGSMCNSSPVFSVLPDIVICAGSDLVVDQSASDPDQDLLKYELCTPLYGGSEGSPWGGNNCYQPGTQGCPWPTEIGQVTWESGYSADMPLGADANLQIDEETGLLTGLPTQKGQYVVGICVTEYRNNIAINTIRRDLQFNVTDCAVVEASIVADDISSIGQYIVADCEGLTIDFENTSIGGTSYIWDFGDPTTSNDFSFEANPSYTYPEPGTYYAKLTVQSDIQSCQDVADIVVNVFPSFEVDFTYDICDNEIRFFEITEGTFGDANQWLWEFGDGASSTEANPSHTYTVKGSYKVKLTAQSEVDCIGQAVEIIDINLDEGIAVKIPIKAFLEGPFNKDSIYMYTHIRDKELLPLEQPFNKEPWFYEGNEAVGSIDEIPGDVVDWVLIELRNPVFPEEVVQQKAGFVLSNGDVIDICASSANTEEPGITFFNAFNANGYHISIKARNHLAVISKKPVQIPRSYPFDFSEPIYVKGGANQLADLDRGYYGLFAGDHNSDGVITVDDYNLYLDDAAILNEYIDGDFNLDNSVTVSDFNVYKPNISIIGAKEIRYE